jgi:hypothetical protein
MLGPFFGGQESFYFVSLRLLASLATFMVLIESSYSFPGFNLHHLVRPLRGFLSARVAALLSILQCASLEYEYV